MTDTAAPSPAKPAAAPAKKAAGTPAKPNPAQQIHKLCARAAKAGNASLRTVDAKAAAEVDEVARWQPDKPVAVVVGETKRGKSSLVNALLGMPGLSPVDAQVATTAYLEFAWAEQASVRAWQPGAADPMLLGVGDLRNWATRLGTMPPGMVPPRRMLVGHPSALLKHMSVVDTPGTGGLDPDHAQIALEAVARATCLIMVTGYSSINAIIKAEMFPAHIRALGVALPFAIANAIFGGTAEYVALYLKDIGHERWFYIYISTLAGLSLIAYIRMRETKTNSLIEED